MQPILKLAIIILVAWVLVTYFVPMLVGIPAIIVVLTRIAIVFGAIYLGWQTLEKL